MKSDILPTINLVKNWDTQKINTYIPFKNNNSYGSELISNDIITNLSKDRNNNFFKKTIFKNKSRHGHEMTTTLSNTSISKPKYWPSRGLYEK